MSDYDEKTLRPILDGYCAVVNAGLDERREKITSKYPGKEYQVVVGLMARQAELSIQLAGNVGIWNGGIPPLVIRCMADCFIVLSWILEDVEKHSLRYLKTSYGKIEFMMSSVDEQMAQNLKNVSVAKTDKTAQGLKKSQVYIQTLEWVRQGLDGWGIKDDVCDKNIPTIKQMAESVGKNLLFYSHFFTPMSLAVHNNWIDVESGLEKDRENPFACKVNETSAMYLGSSAALISEVYTTIDKKLELKCTDNRPTDYWIKHFPGNFYEVQQLKEYINNNKVE